jgi:nanoRNase/pAp phosphatase (c-di-AMP/oligoRNAs hydrolase)
LNNYLDFVNAVTAWDLWQIESPHRKRGENLTSLLGFIGKEEFVTRFVHDPDADQRPTSTLEAIIRHLNARKERYVAQVLKEQLTHARYRMDGLGNTFKIIFATDYISEIAHAALKQPDCEDLHYICVINPVTNSCSLRSREGETDIGQIAKLVGGGGHASASGFPAKMTNLIEETIFKLLNSIEV